jgi:hypothetical protein
VQIDRGHQPPALVLVAVAPPATRASLYMSGRTSGLAPPADRLEAVLELKALAKAPESAGFLLEEGILDPLVDSVNGFVEASAAKEQGRKKLERLRRDASAFMATNKAERELAALAARKLARAPMASQCARTLVALARARCAQAGGAGEALDAMFAEFPHHERFREEGGGDECVARARESGPQRARRGGMCDLRSEPVSAEGAAFLCVR